MSALHIVYDGTPLSGRRTSLAVVLEHVGHVLDPLVDQYSVSFQHRDAHIGLRISLAIQRDKAWHLESVKAGLDHIATAQGIIFVVDSHPARDAETRQRWQQLVAHVQPSTPIVVQVNKRDLAEARPMSDLRREFRRPNCAFLESTANQCIGPVAALHTLLDML